MIKFQKQTALGLRIRVDKMDQMLSTVGEMMIVIVMIIIVMMMVVVLMVVMMMMRMMMMYADV